MEDVMLRSVDDTYGFIYESYDDDSYPCLGERPKNDEGIKVDSKDYIIDIGLKHQSSSDWARYMAWLAGKMIGTPLGIIYD